MHTASGRYEQLIQDLRASARPQREWIERQGLFLIVGHFLSGVGAGTWLFSMVFGFDVGLPLGWAIVALSGLFHLLFLGRPERFWKMVQVGHSWISRGFLGITLFLGASGLYLLPAYVSGIPWTTGDAVGRAALLLSYLGVGILLLYKGFVYAASKGVPFWTSPILPALYIAYALRGGVAVLLIGVPVAGNGVDPHVVGLLELWIGVSAAVLILFYLGVMASTNAVARRSVHELLQGRVALSFYVGTLFIGLFIPIALGLLGHLTPLSQSVLAAVGVASVIGDFFVKFTIAKAGIYLPLRPLRTL